MWLRPKEDWIGIAIVGVVATVIALWCSPAKAEAIPLTVGQHERIAPNFTAKEFWCKCGKCKGKQERLDGTLLYRLELLRIELEGRPIVVTSGMRCKERNKQVGGAKHSQHMSGKAADIKVVGVSMSRLTKAAKKVGFTFVKSYSDHVHVDVR